MKKTFTLFIGVVIATIVCASSAFAQPGTYYPNYFFNQDFTGVEAWPAGWSSVGDNTTYMGQNNGSNAFYLKDGTGVVQNYATIASSGSGSRGNELRFPSTATSTFAGEAVWVMEFDWSANAAEANGTNAMGITLLGPNSVNLHTDGGIFWAAVIAELYVYDQNDNFHFTNLDPIGTDATTGLPIDADGLPTSICGAASGNNSTFFGRKGTDVAEADNLNLSTKTNVKFTTGVWYHILCEMNFETQKVQKFSIYEIDNPENGDTFTDLPFVAPWAAGAASAVDPENRKVTEFDRVSAWATRRSGGNGVVNQLYNNMQLYVWKESVGIADVSVNYVDRDGHSVKAPRVLANQQVTSTIWLSIGDKDNFFSDDDLYYYAYDEEATHAANLDNPQGGGDGESLTVDFQEGATQNPNNILSVVFKKEAVNYGTYIWSGNTNYKWSYLDENFNVSGGPDVSYLPGNPVEFSRTDVTNKEVSVEGALELADEDMTVSAPDYTFSGTGRITGKGSLIVDAPVALATDNRLEGGAIINTDQEVLIQSAVAATQFTTAQPEITLSLQAGATFNKPITGPDDGQGTLNVNMISANECASPISDFSTVNISFKDRGRETSNSWTNPFTSTFSEGTQVNIIDAIEQGEFIYPATYALTNNSLAAAKVHLGDNTRIIFNGTPGANATTTVNIGELTGTANSSIQGNCVGAAYDRILRYSIGASNTDAVFDGSIIPQLSREPGRRSGAYYVWDRLTIADVDTVWYLPSTLQLVKVGTGKWTVGGKIIIPDADSPSTITASEGILELCDSLVAPAVNTVTLTVDAGGTLKTHGNYIGAYNVTVNGTVIGGASYANSFSMVDPSAVLKLNVNSFADGDFDKITTEGDIIIKAGTIDFTVATPGENTKIVILFSKSNYEILDGIEQGKVTVLVNGEDITGNTASDEIPAGATGFYYFDPETGVLGYVGTYNGLPNVAVEKVVKSIDYYNTLGQKVRENNSGVTLKKITYTDGSVQSTKVFNRVN